MQPAGELDQRPFKEELLAPQAGVAGRVRTQVSAQDHDARAAFGGDLDDLLVVIQLPVQIRCEEPIRHAPSPGKVNAATKLAERRALRQPARDSA